MARFGEENINHQLDMDDYFSFGKYQEMLVSDVVEEDPNYIRFLIEETAHDFTDEVKDGL